MSSTATISCEIGTTDSSAELGFEIWIDNNKMFNSDHIVETTPIKLEFVEDETDHILRFVLKNKQESHTKIDASGAIVKDACITISNLEFNDIALGQIFIDLATYDHNYNGSKEWTTEKFYGSMGCNGTVTLPFSTPIYMWLLDKM